MAGYYIGLVWYSTVYCTVYNKQVRQMRCDGAFVKRTCARDMFLFLNNALCMQTRVFSRAGNGSTIVQYIYCRLIVFLL